MQAVEYDLNVTGGLMPQINALTAPPSSDETHRRRKLKKSIARQNQLNSEINSNANQYNNRQILSRQTKTGKAPNHEYCDSCREGGDLLCCDRCPNAFHLQCHDPPLDEEDVPQGEWLCRKCEIGNEEIYVTDDEDSDNPEANEPDSKPLQKPFALLIKAAQTLNPRQFQLPNDMVPSIPLVGSSKKVNPNNKNSVKKQIQELDNNLQVSFPIQLCFQCSKSCRKAPLIQCDYCPLLFHADCLDPPLTALPTGRWMCPNHSMHIVEQKLLESECLSERIKLWNRFNGPLSQDTVKIEFLKKVHRTDPPYRTKLVMPSSPRVVVPQAIKDMYKKRPPLLPTIYDSFSSINEYKTNHYNCKYEKPTPEEEMEWLEALTAFQLSAAQYLSSKRSELKKEVDTSKESESKIREICPEKDSQKVNGPTDHSSDDLFSEKSKNCENKEILKNENKIVNGEKDISPIVADRKISIKNNVSVNTIDELTKNFDEPTIRLLALQRLQQLGNKHIDSINTPSVTPSAQTANTTPPTPYQTSVRRIGLHDVRARAVLCPIIHVKANNSPTTEYSLMSYRTLTIGTSSENDVVLGEYGHCNYVSAKHACIFYDESSRTYELINYSEHGTTVDNVLYSCDFSDKKVQSAKHSNLNSQTVSTVKTVANKRKKKVSDDRRVKNEHANADDTFTDKRHAKRRKLIKEETEGNAQKLFDFKTSKITFRWDHDSENVERVITNGKNALTMSSKSGQSYKPCACKSSCSSLIGANGAGWEGTAILHHGSHIKIGCHQFIFSITNHSIGQNQTNNQSKSPIKAEPTVKQLINEK